jgi:hypothetical protein
MLRGKLKNWSRSYKTLIFTQDLGIYVTGYTGGGLDGNANAGGKDAFIVKFNSDGEKQ